MARDAVIVGSLRTGLTKAHRGSFNLTEPVQYTAHVLREVLAQQPNLDPAEVEDVILGCGWPEGAMGFNMARVASMCAGIPQTSAATTVNRFCSSGSQAVMMAANQILVNGVDVAIGSGVETISMMQDGTSNSNRLFNEEARERFPGLYYPMGRTAEIVAERYDVSREDQDIYALQSQQRYAAAADAGHVSQEIAPMKVTRKVTPKGEDAFEEDFTVDRDECNRPSTTLEGLSALKPVFQDDGTVTAGNASQLSDGGGASLLLAQAIGVVAVGAYVATASWALWKVIKLTIGIRVSPEEELIGLDISEMGLEAYAADTLPSRLTSSDPMQTSSAQVAANKLAGNRT